jgi:multidrug efflux system membrane fusion protein
MNARAQILPLHAVSAIWSIAGLALLAGCGKSDQKAAAGGAQPSLVTAATATSKDVPKYLDTIGQTTAFEAVNIVSQVEGQIVEMPFQQGSLVKKGDVLAVIFQPPFIAAVERSSGLVASDEANLAIAKLQVERSEPLTRDNLVSKQQYDTWLSQVKALEGQLATDRANLELANINLGYSTIHAPVDGMVGVYKINIGNVVKINDAPLTTIQRMDPIYADFVVSVTDFPAVKKYFIDNGGKLAVRIESLSDSTQAKDGNLTILGNAVATSTGTVTVRCTLANENLLFWPNEPVRARILLATLKDAVLVPKEAVQLNQQGRFVFVIKPAAKAGDAETVEQRPVEIGQPQEGGLIVITSGVKAGEKVVVRNPLFLQDGGTVMVSELDGKSTLPPPADGGRGGPPPADKK